MGAVWPLTQYAYSVTGGGRGMRWCWINFHCRGILLMWVKGLLRLQWMRVGIVCTFYSRLSFPISFSLSLGDGPI